MQLQHINIMHPPLLLLLTTQILDHEPEHIIMQQHRELPLIRKDHIVFIFELQIFEAYCLLNLPELGDPFVDV